MGIFRNEIRVKICMLVNAQAKHCLWLNHDKSAHEPFKIKKCGTKKSRILYIRYHKG